MEGLGPEIDCLLIGRHPVIGHLLKRRRCQSPHSFWLHSLNPAYGQQWPIFDVMVGVVMCDEDRLQVPERDPSASILVRYPHSAVENICRPVAQHDMRCHLPGSTGNWSCSRAQQHEFGPFCTFQGSLGLLRRPTRPCLSLSEGLRHCRARQGRDRQPSQNVAAGTNDLRFPNPWRFSRFAVFVVREATPGFSGLSRSGCRSLTFNSDAEGRAAQGTKVEVANVKSRLLTTLMAHAAYCGAKYCSVFRPAFCEQLGRSRK